MLDHINARLWKSMQRIDSEGRGFQASGAKAARAGHPHWPDQRASLLDGGLECEGWSRSGEMAATIMLEHNCMVATSRSSNAAGVVERTSKDSEGATIVAQRRIQD